MRGRVACGFALVGCASLDGAGTEMRVDAAFVGACDAEGCACGGAAMACCAGPPRCEGALWCMGGVCRVPGPRCEARGIFQPGFLVADFIEAAGPTTRPCSEIPRELFDFATPGTFLAPAPEVGALECEGLTPGVYTARLSARIRALPQRHAEVGCRCQGLANATVSVTQRGGATWTVTGNLMHPEGQVDEQCNRGPNLAWSQSVTVGPDGRIALTVDFLGCANDGKPRGLFLRGTSLTLDGVTP